jgi:GNAT superfamily N-acetyltransferase
MELEIVPAAECVAFVAEAQRAFEALFRDGRLVAWLACDDDAVVASCCAVFFDRLPYPDGSRHAELCGVYVAPAYRNRGLASELVSEVVGAARADGARKTYLRPTRAGHALYARLGFVDSACMTFAPASTSHAPEPEPVLAASPRG